MKHLLTITIFLFNLTNYSASNYNGYTDSIAVQLSKFKDEEKVEKYIELINDLREKDVIKGFDLFDKILPFAKSIDYKMGLFKLYQAAALNYTFMDQYDKAIEYHKLAQKQSDYLRDKSHEWKIYNNIGVIYYLLKDYDESLRYFLLAENYLLSKRAPDNNAILYNNIGELYRLVNSLDLSVEYHKKALELFSEFDIPEQLANTYLLLSETLIKQNKYPLAEDYLFKASQLLNKKVAEGTLAKFNKLIGLIAIKKKDQNRANKYLNIALSHAVNSQDKLLEAEIYKSFSKIHETFHEYVQALSFLQKAMVIEDSLQNDKNKEKSELFRIRVERERQLAEENIINLESEKSKNRQLIFVLIAASVFASLLSFAYYIKRKNEIELKNKNQELELTNNKFTSFVEQSQDAFRLINTEGTIILWSKANIELTGISKHDAIGSHFLDITERLMDQESKDERISKISDKVRAVISEGIFEPITVQKSITTLAGEKKHIQDTIFPIETTEGIYIGNISRDITERINYEDELIHARDMAQASDKMKSEFLAQMSHEIRTPINTILSFSGLVEAELEGKLPDTLVECFVSIHSAGERITRTIDMLLNMSELQTGTYELIPRDINLEENIITPILNEFDLAVKQKSIKLKYSPHDSALHFVADEYSIGQIIHNLVSNGIKFTSKGHVEIKTGIDHNENVFIQVVDTGIGIHRDYHKNLFHPFTQEEQGYTRSYEGNGLGLALVKKYCELNNATIAVESEKGKGSCFTVTFGKNVV